MASFWIIRAFFMILSVLGGYAISEVQPQLIPSRINGALVGFGFGGLLIAVDEMLKGFSLRAFSAATFGLILGSLIAWMVDRSGLFVYADEQPTRWLIRLCLFMGFTYIGMVLALRSNKEDFSLIIPYVRFTRQDAPPAFTLLDTSAIIDGRVADLIENRFIEGTIVVPRFVLAELQNIADSSDPLRRARGRRGLETLSRIQKLKNIEFKLHEGDFPEELAVDTKLMRLAKATGAKLYTTDFNLGKVAELQGIAFVNMVALGNSMKMVVLPGELVQLRVVREGKDKGQGVGYLNDGTMVVINHGAPLIGSQVEVQIQSTLQTGAGVIVFADVRRTHETTFIPKEKQPI
ncbi:MAG: PIN domain-containing protein [Limisphaerales bacterium]